MSTPRKGRASLGDGDDCPVVADHGAMFALRGTQVQWCPDQFHDGTPGKDGRPASRAKWPLGHISFAAEVAAYNATTAGEAAKRLPDLGVLELPDLEGVTL